MKMYGPLRLTVITHLLILVGAIPTTFGGGQAGAAPESSGHWRANYFPNDPLVTQDGETVHFYSVTEIT